MVCQCHRPYRQELIRELIKARQQAELNRQRFRCSQADLKFLRVDDLVQRFCR